MYCPQKLSYTIRPRDNLYQLARYYQTTVPMILAQNPNIDPYNLQVGTSVVICPGDNFAVQPNNNPPSCPNSSRQISLINDMRLVWSQHVYWTRMLIISIADRLKDQSAVTDRLLQNPNDISAVFAQYYPDDVARKISQLLTEHLKIGAALITALRDGKKLEADSLNREWYINADQMAEAFAGINPYYNRENLRDMLYKHLQLTTQEASMRLSRQYTADIEVFDRAEQQMLAMADMFAHGLMQQFPQSFI